MVGSEVLSYTQVPHDVLKELSDNINKFVESLNSAEGLVYLKLMKKELGYIRTSDFQKLIEYASMVFKTMPAKVRSKEGCLLPISWCDTVM